ncbi:MAG TPA: hypothetical protein VGE32_01525, partial [Cellvibrio sp.]
KIHNKKSKEIFLKGNVVIIFGSSVRSKAVVPIDFSSFQMSVDFGVSTDTTAFVNWCIYQRITRAVAQEPVAQTKKPIHFCIGERLMINQGGKS